MQFGGLQKLTLLDYPDKTACTVFTVGCNYRCPFCHNGSLVLPQPTQPTLDESEILAFLQTRIGLLDGVCVSGGEPLLHKGLPDFLANVKAMGFTIKLDTNGSFPQRLKALVEAGWVDYVAMDVKNAPDQYAATIGVRDYDLTPVRATIDYLLSNAVPYEFRTTVVRELHTQAGLQALAAWIQGAQKYYLQAFVDGDDLLQRGLSGYSAAEMQALRAAVAVVLPVVELRGI